MAALKRWLTGLAGLACGACASAPPLRLPEAPPRAPAAALARWQSPPPLQPDDVDDPVGDWEMARGRLRSGLGLNVVSRPESKSTALLLWLPAAADASEGLVAVTAEALRAGTHTRSGARVVDPRLARQPIAIRTDATGTTLTWQVLPRSTEQALGLLADFVGRPSFEPEATRVVLQQELARIQRDSGSLWHLANLARNAVAGINVPSPWSDALGLLDVTPERLRATQRCVLHARGAELVVVGPAPAAELLAAASAAFAELPGQDAAGAGCGQRPALPSLANTERNDRVELQIIYGGTFDPFLVLVTPGPAPSSPDYLPFVLAAEVLDSRDSARRGLRHSGATYGISAHVNEGFPGGTLLEIAGQVAPEKARDALRTLVWDVKSLHRTLGTDELEKVKRRHQNAFVNGLGSNLALATETLALVRRGKPPEALKSWPLELRAVSVERCREVAARWLRLAEPSIAVAGVPVPLVRGLGFRANVRRMYWTDQLQDRKKAL